MLTKSNVDDLIKSNKTFTDDEIYLFQWVYIFEALRQSYTKRLSSDKPGVAPKAKKALKYCSDIEERFQKRLWFSEADANWVLDNASWFIAHSKEWKGTVLPEIRREPKRTVREIENDKTLDQLFGVC